MYNIAIEKNATLRIKIAKLDLKKLIISEALKELEHQPAETSNKK